MLHYYHAFFPAHFHVWYLALLFLAGLVGESFGALVGGGSIITLPALLFTGIPLQSAIAIDNTMTLGTLAGIISETYKQAIANKKLVLLMAIPSLLGSIIGTWLLLTVSGTIIRYLLAIVVIFIVVHAYFVKKPDPKLIGKTRYMLAMAFIVLVGIYSSFLSAGQGAFSRIGLMSILGWSFMQTQGITATAAIPARIYSLVVTGIAGLIVWPYLVTMWCSTFIAGKYATKFAKHVPDAYMRAALIVVSLLFVIYLLFFY